MKNLRYYLLFDRIKIHGANALSSPITYGFPAISGFVGAIHALSRNIPNDQGISLKGVLIASHKCDVQAFRPHDFADYSFNQTRNPIKRDGKTASIIEEGKVHLEVSLVVEVVTESRDILRDAADKEVFLSTIKQKLTQQRIAGGSVENIKSVTLFSIENSADIIKALLPAFVLMEAKADLIEITEALQKENSKATALDALIEMATLHHIPKKITKENVEEEGKEIKWAWTATTKKSGRGWLVPIPIGFQRIFPSFEAGVLANCRTDQYPSQYVESIYSLGKWMFPSRLADNFQQGFWRYHQPQEGLYLLTQS